MRLDEQELNNRYKIGVLYCKAGQTSEEEWYNNGTWVSLFIHYSFIKLFGQSYIHMYM